MNIDKFIINDINDLKKLIKSNLYNKYVIEIVDNKIMVSGVKVEVRTNGGNDIELPPKPPRITASQVMVVLQTFIVEQRKFNENQLKFNNRVEQFMIEQLKFNEEQRKFNKYVLDVFKRNDLK